MDLNEYQDKTDETAIYPDKRGTLGIAYCALKLAGEAGEEAEKAFRRRAIPLTLAQEIERWRAEYRAAFKHRHDPIVVRLQFEAAQEAKP